MSTKLDREKEIENQIRSAYGAKEVRDLPQLPEGRRFEIMLPDRRRYRIDVNEVDAGPFSTIKDPDGSVRPMGEVENTPAPGQ